MSSTLETWPPIKPRSVTPVIRDDDFSDDNGSVEYARPLPADWVHRALLKTNLDDDDALDALLTESGSTCQPYCAPWRVPEPQRRRLAEPDHEMPMFPGHLDDDESWWESVRLDIDAGLEDERWWLKTASTLTRIWDRAASDDANLDPAAIWRAEGFTHLGLDAPEWFAEMMNVGLRPFQPRVARFADNVRTVGLYSAACLQIFNLMDARTTSARCEGCGRTFAVLHHRQRFCDASCEQATRQRRYRARQKAKRTV